MDPILDKVVKQLTQIRTDHPADFRALKKEDIDAFIREETQGKFGLADLTHIDGRNLGRSAVQGLTMNWGDELLGLAGGDKEGMRTRQDLFHKSHPVVDVGTQVVTGALPFFALPAAKGASLLAQMGRGAAIGAGSGAVAGAGAGDNADERKQGALVGGLLGGGLGAAIPGAAGVLKTVRSPAAVANARLATAIEKSGGIDKVRGTAQDFAANGRGDQVMLGDLSPQLRNAADFAATNSEDVFVPLTQKLAGRQTDASDRLLQDTRGLLGSDPHAETQQAALEAARNKWAAGPEGYGGLRDANPTFDTAPLAQALKHPTIQDAWRQARLAGDLTEVDPINKMLMEVEKARPVNFNDLQQLKRALDDRVGGAFARGNGELGRAYATIRNTVNDVLEQGAPGYKAVNAENHRLHGLENALKAGQEAWETVDSRGLASRLGTMAPEQIEQFRIGMASKMIAKLRSAATNRDEATKLVNSSPAQRDKLMAVFGDRPTFDQFMKRAEAEAELHKLNAAVGNSATARRLQSANVSPGEMGIKMAEEASHGLVSSALRGIGKATKGALARGAAREMGPSLLTQGQPAIDQLLTQLQSNSPLVKSLWAHALPGVAGRAGLGLFEP